MLRDIPERDWKVLRDLHQDLIERSRQRSLEKVSRLIADSRKTSRERYVAIRELMREEDDDFDVAMNDVRRSTAMMKLAAMWHRKLLTDDEMSRFSPETRDAVNFLLHSLRNSH